MKPDRWEIHSEAAYRVVVFTGNRRAAGLFALFAGLLAVALVPFALAGMAGIVGWVRGAAAFAELVPLLVLVASLSLVVASLAALSWRLFAGTTEIELGPRELVVASGVGALRWRRRADLSTVVGIRTVGRGRWHGVEIDLRPGGRIRAGSGGADRAAYLAERVRRRLEARAA